jgi:hypothetical protein
MLHALSLVHVVVVVQRPLGTLSIYENKFRRARATSDCPFRRVTRARHQLRRTLVLCNLLDDESSICNYSVRASARQIIRFVESIATSRLATSMMVYVQPMGLHLDLRHLHTSRIIFPPR